MLELCAIPEWVSKTVFYQIFPDRFAKSPHAAVWGTFQSWGTKPKAHGLMGGNLKGIQENLDSIVKLGCNAIYLCPIFSSSANHRYHTSDYYSIDPILGTMDDFDALLAACHAQGIRVILDGVFNHCSRGIYQFASLLEEGPNSPFVDWFRIKKWPLKAYSKKANYECWWGIPALPKWNTSHPQVREFLFEIAEFWTKKGIDGWRLDVPNEINDDSFWQEFRRRVKKINPDAYIVGEIWEDPSRWLQGDQFDGVMHYLARKAILSYLLPQENEAISVHEFCQKMNECHPENQFGYPMGLLGSHDTIRLATLAKGRSDALRIAWAMLFFLPAAPCVYYGDEVSLEGGKDPDNRRCFPWQGFQDQGMLSFLQNWISIRKNSLVLQKGGIHFSALAEGVRVDRNMDSKQMSLIVAVSSEKSYIYQENQVVLSFYNGAVEGHRIHLQKGGYVVLEGELT